MFLETNYNGRELFVIITKENQRFLNLNYQIKNILVDNLLDAEPQLNPNRPVRDVDQLDYNMFHKYGKKHKRRK